MNALLRRSGFGIVALSMMVLCFLSVLWSASTGIGFDAENGSAVLIVYVILPLVALAVVIAVIGLFADRKRLFAGIALFFVPMAIGLGNMIGWGSGLVG